MEPIPEILDPSAYLAADEVIDHDHPLVRETAARLRTQAPALHDYAKSAFEFVRDTIPHSQDAGDLRVTWRASDVLELRTGICYAKAHALAALLRAEGIPAGLCYQFLGEIHGLVALKLPGHDGWARQDPRGNKPGVDAQFCLTEERLAFVPDAGQGEFDYPTLYAATPAPVLDCLQRATDRPHLWRTLPTAL
jgi:transglutaminase-like putative cysteine protease